jgi:hypothetical protein
MIGRRSFISGLVALVASPAIVRASTLMPVRSVVWDNMAILALIEQRLNDAQKMWEEKLTRELFTSVPGGEESGLGALMFDGVPLEFDPPSTPDTVYLIPGYPLKSDSVSITIQDYFR